MVHLFPSSPRPLLPSTTTSPPPHPPHLHLPSLPSSSGLQRSRQKSTASLQLLKYRFYCLWDPRLLLCIFLTQKHTVIQLYVLLCTRFHTLAHTHTLIQFLTMLHPHGHIFRSSICPL